MTVEAETSTSGTAPYTNGSPVANGANGALKNSAVNGSAAALVANGKANGAAIALGDVDASSVISIEDDIDACGAGQLEACAVDR